MRQIFPFKRYTPEAWPAGYDGSGNQPQFDAPGAGAWFGIPAYTNDLDYWINKTGLPLWTFSNSEIGMYIGESGKQFRIPLIAWLWCFETSPASTKAHVAKVNQARSVEFFEFLRAFQAYNVSPQAAIDNIRKSPTFVEFTENRYSTYTRDVSPGIANALQVFYNQNGRLPRVIFSEYNGDPRLPVPFFESDEYGVKAPTWAALSTFANPNHTGIVFTDYGPRFANRYEYRRFQAAFWRAVVGNMSAELERGGYGAGVSSTVGTQYISFSRPADLDEFFQVQNGYQTQYVQPIPAVMARGIANQYSTRILEFSRIMGDMLDKQAAYQFAVSAFALFTAGSLFAAAESLFSGEITFSNVFKTLKLADSIGVVDADKIIAVGNLGDAVYSMSQSAIDGVSTVTLEESPELDDAIQVAYTAPIEQPDTIMGDIDWDAWLEGQTALEEAAGWDFSGYTEEVFDWSSVDFSGITAFEFEPFDWGAMGSDTPFDPAFVEGAGMEWAMVSPDMTVDQLASINALDESTRAEAAAIVQDAQRAAVATGGDFLSILGAAVKNIQGATGAFLTLYTTYKKAEQVIKSGGGNVTAKPSIVSRPTQPGQSTRQPDGSISTMLADGSIRTVRPDGSVIVTAPTAALPSFNTLFSKQNLLIAGGVTAVVFAVSALRRGR